MGISGLLPFLDNSSKSVHISRFRGCTAAVDTYCWLHKGAFGCSEKLARGEETDGYVLYCLKYIRILQNAGVRPIMVFDGRHLPAKREIEEKRRELRKVARQRAAELYRLDRADEARSYLKRCIDVTHGMALALIKECRKMGVDCIVAPYEADAQMAFFSINKIADVVITEDSDLVLFGCEKILFKLDLMGNGILVEKDKLHLSMQMSPDVYNFDKFRYMCILSGCDYIQSLPGIGLKKALKFLKLTANPDIHQTLKKLPSYLNMRQVVVTDEYRDEFMVALATFKHQIIYNPLKRKLEHLTDPEASGTPKEHLKNAGEFFDEDTAFQLALGNLDPFTLKKVDDWNPNKAPLKITSIWCKDYNKAPTKPKPPSPSLLKKMVKSTRNINVTVAVENLTVSEKDDDFEDELQIYKTKKVEKVEEIDYKAKEMEETIVKATIDERTSFNPFIKGTKIPRTVVHRSRIIKSRFFSNTSDSQQSTSTFIDSSCEETHTEEAIPLEDTDEGLFSLEKDPTLSDLDNSCEDNNTSLESPKQSIDYLCDIINLEAEEETTSEKKQQTATCNNTFSITERFSVGRLRRKMVILEKNQPTSDEKLTTESQQTNSSTQEENDSFQRLSLDKRKRSVSIDDEVDDGNDSNVENLTPPCRVQSSVNTTTTTQIVKRSNLGPCRTLGLQKKNVKKTPGKNQPTLLAMFAAIKK